MSACTEDFSGYSIANFAGPAAARSPCRMQSTWPLKALRTASGPVDGCLPCRLALVETSGPPHRLQSAAATGCVVTRTARPLWLTAQPCGDLGQAWQYPGDRTRPGFPDTGLCCRVQRQQQRLELCKITGNQYQPLLDTALFQCQQLQHGRCVERITAEAVNRFCGVGDYSAMLKPAHRFADFPAHFSPGSCSAPGTGLSQGSTNLHSCCGQTRWVPERLVVLMDVIGQWHCGQGWASGTFQMAYSHFG